MISFIHPLLSLPGPATAIVTNLIALDASVPIGGDSTTNAVLSNFMPRPDCGTVQGVVLESAMEPSGFVTRLDGGSLRGFAATSLSVMLDAARIARRSAPNGGVTEAERRMPKSTLPDGVGTGWGLSVTKFLQCADAETGVQQELGHAILTSSDGHEIIFSRDPSGNYYLLAGYRVGNAMCEIQVRMDMEKGRVCTAEYSFRLEGNSLVECKRAADLKPHEAVLELAKRLVEKIVRSGQFLTGEITAAFEFRNDATRFFIASHDGNTIDDIPHPIIQLIGHHGYAETPARLTVTLLQPQKRTQGTADALWPLKVGLRTLLWDPVLKIAAPDIYARQMARSTH